MNNRTFGIVLIVIGVMMIAYGGYSYVSSENLVQVGHMEINREMTHTAKWPPIVGIIAIIGGIVLVVKKNTKS